MIHSKRDFSFPMRQHLVPWLRYKYVQQIHSSTKWRVLMGLSIFSETEYFLPPLLVNSINSVVVFMNILAWGLVWGSCFPAFPERKAQRGLPNSTVGVLSASWMVQCRPMSRLITKAPTKQNKYLTSYRKGTKPNSTSEENNASVVTGVFMRMMEFPHPRFQFVRATLNISKQVLAWTH